MKLEDYIKKLPNLFFRVKKIEETKKQGVLDYNDLATATTPIALVGGAGYTFLTNDGLGPFTNKKYPPEGITDVWDASLNQFDFSQLPLGSTVKYRVDVEVITTAINQEVDIAIELAIGGTTYDLDIVHTQYKSVGTYKIVSPSFVYMGDLNTRDNPAKIKIKSTDNATIEVTGWACIVALY